MGFREYDLMDCLNLFSNEDMKKRLGQEHTVSKSLLLIPAFLMRPLSTSLLEASNRGSLLVITIPSRWKRESTNEPCPS